MKYEKFILSLQRVTGNARTNLQKFRRTTKDTDLLNRKISKRTMKATKLRIGFREWSKLPDFVATINEEDELLAYEIDATTALLVAPGECGLAWIEAQAAQWFEDYEIENIKQ